MATPVALSGPVGTFRVDPTTVMALLPVPTSIVAAESTYVVLEGNVREIADGAPAAVAVTLDLPFLVTLAHINTEDWLCSADHLMALVPMPASVLGAVANGTYVVLHGNVQIDAFGTVGGVAALIAVGASVLSGSYTPSLTEGVNVSASNFADDSFRWMRVRDQIFVTGSCTITVPVAVLTSFEIDLPVASAITLVQEVTGSLTALVVATGGTGGVVSGSVVNNTAVCTFFAVGIALHAVGISFAYTVA